MKFPEDGFLFQPKSKLSGIGLLGLLLMAILWVGPTLAAPNSPAFYEVRQGDYLGLIAQKFGVTVSELRSTNRLATDVLRIGQELRLENPFHRNLQTKVKWNPPCHSLGKVFKQFGPYKKKGIIMPSTGTDLACATGTAVSSPAIGLVRHIGHMDGFGTLIIIQHGGGYATVFSPFDTATIAVKMGQALLPGDHLGRTGPPPDKDTPSYLHVELRLKDKAINPDPLLK